MLLQRPVYWCSVSVMCLPGNFIVYDLPDTFVSIPERTIRSYITLMPQQRHYTLRCLRWYFLAINPFFYFVTNCNWQLIYSYLTIWQYIAEKKASMLYRLFIYALLFIYLVKTCFWKKFNKFLAQAIFLQCLWDISHKTTFQKKKNRR